MTRDAVGCKKKVSRHGLFAPTHCTRKAVRDGYCTQHHPDSVAKRDAESRARYEAKLERQREARRLAAEQPIREAVAARDAAWREAVARVRKEHTHPECVRLNSTQESWLCSLECDASAHNAALDALLRAMEGQ